MAADFVKKKAFEGNFALSRATTRRKVSAQSRSINIADRKTEKSPPTRSRKLPLSEIETFAMRERRGDLSLSGSGKMKVSGS